MTERKNENASREPGRKTPETATEKNTKKESRKQQKTLRAEFLAVAAFIILSLIGIFLANRFLGGNETKDSPEKTSNSETIELRSDVETEESSAEIPPSETEIESESETETEPESETETETEVVAPSLPEFTKEPETKPIETSLYYPYAPLAEGLSYPVQSGITMPSWITQDILKSGADSRPGTPIGKIRYVCIHYVGNKGSSPKANRDYFESNVDGRKVSSHFIVGMYGEIIQCVPMNEVAYAQGVSKERMAAGMPNRNYDSISIENCHPDDTGQFTSETYWALVKLCAWLLEQYGLDETALIRHYDATTSTALGIHGKGCPLYFVQHPDAWEQFKQAVKNYMVEYPDIQ